MSISSLMTMTQEALDERAAQFEEQIIASGAAVLDVVAKDLGRFLEREAKRRFVEQIEFASAMDEASLAAFRGALRELAVEAEATLRGELTGSPVWITDVLPEDRKTLRGNPAVWQAVQAVACKLAGLLGKYNFPPDDGEEGPDYAIQYDTPRYFIDHIYCPGLIEAYWKQVEELAAVRGAIASRVRVKTQNALEARWDAID
jgi:hypothetical protein